jgi:hypothetical protein
MLHRHTRARLTSRGAATAPRSGTEARPKRAAGPPQHRWTLKCRLHVLRACLALPGAVHGRRDPSVITEAVAQRTAGCGSESRSIGLLVSSASACGQIQREGHPEEGSRACDALLTVGKDGRHDLDGELRLQL